MRIADRVVTLCDGTFVARPADAPFDDRVPA